MRSMHTSQLSRLALLAEQAASEQPDLIALLAETVKAVAASEADPYLAIGALIEGVAHSIGARIPPERQADTAWAAVGLLATRLRAVGLV